MKPKGGEAGAGAKVAAKAAARNTAGAAVEGATPVAEGQDTSPGPGPGLAVALVSSLAALPGPGLVQNLQTQWMSINVYNNLLSDLLGCLKRLQLERPELA